MHHLFLINPTAGPRDRSREVAQVAQVLCGQLGEPCRVRVSEYSGHLTEMAREAGQSGIETRVYACGGDGTLNEVVTGAMGYDNLSVTSFPCGSGNDFIKHFSAPEAFFQMENFAQAETQPVDVIRVNDRYALNICSVGFDARIGTAIDAYRRHPMLSGPRAYHASVAVNLVKGVSKPLQVETREGLVVDGRLTLVCVCNGSWYGGSSHARRGYSGRLVGCADREARFPADGGPGDLRLSKGEICGLPPAHHPLPDQSPKTVHAPGGAGESGW